MSEFNFKLGEAVTSEAFAKYLGVTESVVNATIKAYIENTNEEEKAVISKCNLVELGNGSYTFEAIFMFLTCATITKDVPFDFEMALINHMMVDYRVGGNPREIFNEIGDNK